MHASDKIKHTNPGLIFLLGFIYLFIVYGTTLASMVGVWLSENSYYSHGLLLFPISMILIYKEWNKSSYALIPSFNLVFTLLLGILTLLWFISKALLIQVGSQLAFILMLAIYIYSVYGLRNSLRLSFPIFILISTLPLWSVFAEPFQVPTAKLVNLILSLTGYTSYQEGYYIHIPEGIFEVGDTCSGVRYQIAAITTTALYVYYNNLSFIRSTLYILLSSFVAFLSNTIRIYIVVLSGHYTNMTHSLLEDHIWLGWVVFALVFLVFIFTLDKFTNERITAVNPNISKNTNVQSIGTLHISVILSIITLGPALNLIYSFNIQNTNSTVSSLNLNLPDWVEKKPEHQWKPTWLSSDYESFSSYTNGSDEIDLFISTYLYQQQGRELISDLNQLYDPDIWHLTNSGDIESDQFDNRDIVLREISIKNRAGEERLIWYTYYIGGIATQNSINARLQGIISTLSGRNDASIVVISSKQTSNIKETRASLISFLNQNFFTIITSINDLVDE